jgi:hypothetical protein
MIQGIGDNVIFRRENSGDGSGIGRESGLEDNTGLGVLELRYVLLQLLVPEMVRTAPEPAPTFLVASTVASTSLG